MYGVVLATGRGTRIQPLTDRRPKPLLPVGDRSLLERVFDAAGDVLDEFVVVTDYRGEAIREALGESYRDRPVHYVEQAEGLGTAHAVAQVEPVVDDDFLVLNGDVVVDASLPLALADAGAPAVAATEIPDPRAYGVLSTAEDGSLADIVEKPADPPMNLANVGCYAFEPKVFEYIDHTPESERGEYEITTTIDLLLGDDRWIDVARYYGTWLDVGRPWELLAANELALAELSDEREIAGTVEEDVHLHGPVIVEEGSRVRSGTYVEGPPLIREGADVGPNAYVRGATVVGPDPHVGHSVEVKNLANRSQDQVDEIEEIVARSKENPSKTTTEVDAANDEIQSTRDDIQGVLENQKQILTAVEQTESGTNEIAAATDEQASVAEEISSAVDDVSERATVVSEEIAEIADENESQTGMVSQLTRQVEQIDRELAEVMDASV